MKSVAFVPALLAAVSAATTSPPHARYSGTKVIRLPVGERVDHVNKVIESLGLETWQAATRPGAVADVVIPSSKMAQFKKDIDGMDFDTMHEDLGKSIAEETNFNTYAAGEPDDSWFDSYHSYDDHLQFLSDLQELHANNSEIVTSGKSGEGNDITGIHFWGSSGKGKNPAVVLHGAVHAREWISTAVVEYFLYNLLTNYGSDDETTGHVDKYDFIIFPNVNPDGFIYTQTDDRMWRKNRQQTQGSSCLGHDINRNWDYKWDTSGGASDNPCAEDFRGKSAGDTAEFQGLSKFLQSTKDAQGVKLYIDYHSYSQLFMTPYGYTCDDVPANNDEYQSLAKGAVAAIKEVHGTVFDYGPICTTIYPASGSSVDYVADVVKGEYAMTSELRDTGRYGFVLPPKEIRPSGEEAYAGFKYLLANMK